jgi:hypothetical protein
MDFCGDDYRKGAEPLPSYILQEGKSEIVRALRSTAHVSASERASMPRRIVVQRFRMVYPSNPTRRTHHLLPRITTSLSNSPPAMLIFLNASNLDGVSNVSDGEPGRQRGVVKASDITYLPSPSHTGWITNVTIPSISSSVLAPSRRPATNVIAPMSSITAPAKNAIGYHGRSFAKAQGGRNR